MLAVRVYLGRFEQLFDDRGGAIFSGVAYTDAHVTLTGMLVVAGGARRSARRWRSSMRWPRRSFDGSIAAVVPAVVCYVVVGVLAVVRQRLHREAERAGARNAVHRAQHRVHAPGVRPRSHRAAAVSRRDRASRRSTSPTTRPRSRTSACGTGARSQDTLRQIQAIRTYYEFPDVDIDRYMIDGTLRQMMVAARELNVERLPESGRNWINTKLIYTHGYGVTMNPVNGFTPEGHADARPEQHAGRRARSRA